MGFQILRKEIRRFFERLVAVGGIEHMLKQEMISQQIEENFRAIFFINIDKPGCLWASDGFASGNKADDP